jgi:hypothetical protein
MPIPVVKRMATAVHIGDACGTFGNADKAKKLLNILHTYQIMQEHACIWSATYI